MVVQQQKFFLHKTIALSELTIFTSSIYSGKNSNKLLTHIKVHFSSFRTQHKMLFFLPVCCWHSDQVDSSLSAYYSLHLTALLWLMGHSCQREVERHGGQNLVYCKRSRCCLVRYPADECLEPIFLLSVPMLAGDFLLSSAVAQPSTST